MLAQLRPALVLLILMTFITGIAYPFVVTAVAKLAFANKAEGSVIHRDGRAIGSELIGQPFSGP
jgi:potassium-transporting ATPase KdpC subunit